MEIILLLKKKQFKLVLSSTDEELQMVLRKFGCFLFLFQYFSGRLGGWMGMLIENKVNSAHLELKLGLSLAISAHANRGSAFPSWHAGQICSVPHQHKRNILGAHICKFIFKHLPPVLET